MIDIQAVGEVARAAGAVIMGVYGEMGGAEVRLKADDSPVTRADRLASVLICERLGDLYPGIPAVSEEGRLPLYGERRLYDRYWLIDPLDGTKEFIAQNGEFTVNIALVAGERAVLGVVYVPTTGALYYAAVGEGAWVERDGAPRERLRVAAFRMTDVGLRVPVSRSHLGAATRGVIEGLRAPVLVPMGSSLKMLLLAEGRADYYPRLGPTYEWDTAAPQVILEEAGGRLLDWHSGRPLVYNKVDLENPWFLGVGEVL